MITCSVDELNKIVNDSIKNSILEIKTFYPNFNEFYWLENFNACEMIYSTNKVFMVNKEAVIEINAEKQPFITDELKINILKQPEGFDFETFLGKKKLLDWFDNPSWLTTEIHNTNYEIIEFIRTLKRDSFKFHNYRFFAQRADIYNEHICVEDMRNGDIYRIYKPYLSNRCVRKNNIVANFQHYEEIPTMPKHIEKIEVVKGKSSKYKENQLKKMYLKYVNKNYKPLNTKMFYVFNLLNVMQNGYYYDDWFSDFHTRKPYRAFLDNLTPAKENEEYFYIGNSDSVSKITKVAILYFKKPEYVTKNPYISSNIKFKHWELSKEEIKQIMIMFKEHTGYKNTLKNKIESLLNSNEGVQNESTSWEDLVWCYQYSYNYINIKNFKKEDEMAEKLMPFDLPMPNYLKLLEPKSATILDLNLQKAIKCNNQKRVKKLLSKGANPNAVIENNKTIFEEFLLSYTLNEYKKEFQKHYPNIEIKNANVKKITEEMKGFRISLEQEYFKLLRLFVEYGAKTDNLYCAIYNSVNDIRPVKYLLERGSKIDDVTLKHLQRDAKRCEKNSYNRYKIILEFGNISNIK